MVPQTITCPSRSDDIGNLYINSDTKRYGFFANESKDSKYFESGRHRSFKAKQGSAGERSDRSDRRRKHGNVAIVLGARHQLLIRGKGDVELDYLKMEPTYETTMFHDTDCEFFQDLVQWCSGPAKEEPTPIIDSKKVTEERAHKNVTYTTNSPYGWEAYDTNSPIALTGMACITPSDPLSPTGEGLGQFQKLLSPSGLSDPNRMQYPEQFLDLNNMPVVFGDLGSVKTTNADAVQTAGLVDWNNTNTNSYIDTYHTDTHNTMPFIEPEELKSQPIIPRELENNDVIITEVIFGASGTGGAGKPAAVERRRGLTVNIPTRVAGWPADIISTPDILSCVEQLENENEPILVSTPTDWLADDTGFASTDISFDVKISPKVDYEPITPKSESLVESENDDKSYTSSRKRHYDSEESDETYTPYQEPTTRRKYTRRKPNVPIKDMIKALEGSQPVMKAKRGRPPKRRESTVSSVCSVDDNSVSASSNQESKYRELRDKNNEASKRSRMNRKLKELQVEQLAIELEEKNKKLQIKADILEDMTKRLKDALMTAILQKK